MEWRNSQFKTDHDDALSRHFLLVLAAAKTSEDFLEWYGLVESKIRRLISSLEHNNAIKTIHINPSSFVTQDEEYTDRPHAAWFIGINFKKSDNVNIDLTNDINKFVEGGEYSEMLGGKLGVLLKSYKEFRFVDNLGLIRDAGLLEMGS